jgi:cytochrome c peroxidase
MLMFNAGLPQEIAPQAATREATRMLRTASAFFLAVCFAAPAASEAPARRIAAVAPPATAPDLHWRLPAVPMPKDNVSTPARVELGKVLFFDPRLSGSGTISCASCHSPSLGWSDGLKTAVGMDGGVLGRATPTIVNTAFNTQFMWDGRSKSLEDQALGPMRAADEMNTDFPAMLARLRSLKGYVTMFNAAYPGEGINDDTIAKALAAFERSVITRDTPFDRWVAGDAKALTLSQWRGFKVFTDPAKGNCAACHSAPNFTDNGFHNIGINPKTPADLGRFNIRKVASMKGAFKTPSLRDVELTAPYFRDGSAATLRDVVDHYERGGDDLSNLSTDMKPLKLSGPEKLDLVAFLKALTGKSARFVAPELPQ